MRNYFKMLKTVWHRIATLPEILEKLNYIALSEKQISERLDCLALSEKQISERLDCLKNKIDSLENKIDVSKDEFIGEVRLLQKSDEIRFWNLYRAEDESDIETRKRFFSSIPKASEDSGLRLLQLGNALLLKKLSEICVKNNFQYWLQSGTLLGAVRHKGFVPWDDDTDCAMFREDIEKLRALLRDDKDFCVTLIYDWWAKSRQIRFRSRDLSIPCFVDIYIYDECENGSDEYWEEQKKLRADLVRKIEENTAPEIQYWKEHPYIDEQNECAPFLENMFNSLRAAAGEKITASDKKAKSVCWGLDNFSVGWKRLFEWNFLFPCTKLQYEGNLYNAPKEYYSYIRRQYGDIWELPRDLISHFHHVSHEELEKDSIKKKIMAFLNVISKNCNS